MLTETDIAARADNKVAAEIGNETVILDIESGYYFQLNVTGARIWNFLEAPLSIGALCAKLEAAFEIDADTCRNEVTAFVETMRDKNLVRIS